jgi:dolichol-phosphate mannosyltransferase
MKRIALVIPCYNEEGSLPHTLRALIEARKKIPKAYHADIIFVNDGSADTTEKLLEEASREHDFIYYRSFARNVGHQSALRAGLNAAADYDAVVMLDADLQHPPELIPDMIKQWEAGYKIVQMIRNDSTSEAGMLQYIRSRGYYWVLTAISDIKLEYGASDFRLIDGSVAKQVAQSPERHLFLRGYFAWMPVSRTTINYKPNKRIAGTTKYTLRKLLDLAYKSILQFSEKPLRMAVTLGLAIAFASIVYGVVLIALYVSGEHTVSGWTSLMVAMLFCFGVNFIILGIIGHYLAHSLSIQKQRPEFVVAAEKLPPAQK